MLLPYLLCGQYSYDKSHVLSGREREKRVLLQMRERERERVYIKNSSREL